METRRTNGEETKIYTNDIIAPRGWEAADGTAAERSMSEEKELQLMKKKIGLHLPFISHGVEQYIQLLDKTFNIPVSAVYISVNSDTTFHVNLLISQEDYLSPKLQAAKMKANGYFNAIGNVSVQFRFTVTEEYLKSHYAKRSVELNYAFRKEYGA